MSIVLPRQCQGSISHIKWFQSLYDGIRSQSQIDTQANIIFIVFIKSKTIHIYINVDESEGSIIKIIITTIIQWATQITRQLMINNKFNNYSRGSTRCWNKLHNINNISFVGLSFSNQLWVHFSSLEEVLEPHLNS